MERSLKQRSLYSFYVKKLNMRFKTLRNREPESNYSDFKL